MRIIATSPVPEVAHALFAEFGAIEVRERNDLHDAEVVLLRGGSIDADAMEAMPGLRVIARTGAGYDNIDVSAATERGIAVLFAPGEGRRAIAEGTILLILAAVKRLGELSAVVRSGDWRQRYDFPGRDVEGLTLGLVGLGQVGWEVARLASAIGMRVVGHDPWAQRSDLVHQVALAQLIERADVISLHCALTAETRGMIDAELLSRTRRGAILVNAARGQIIESEDVLYTALTSGQLSGIGLDVYPSEPPDFAHPLYADPRVICTPHTVGLTEGWNRAVFQRLAQGLAELNAGRRPENVLNPEVFQAFAPLAGHLRGNVARITQPPAEA